MVDVSIAVKTNNIQVNVVLTSSIPANPKSTIFSDADGVDKYEWKDSDGFVMARIDSKGNLYFRGKVQRV